MSIDFASIVEAQQALKFKLAKLKRELAEGELRGSARASLVNEISRIQEAILDIGNAIAASNEELVRS